jgi:trigger factor
VKSAVETLSPTRVKLTVEVPFEELEPSLKNAYKRIAAQVTVPGFRRGKVPAAIIDQRFGRQAVLDEAINDVLPKAYDEAVKENDLKPLGQPEVDIQTFEDREPLKFTAELDVRPEITLPELEGIELKVDDIEVSDEDVAKEIDALRARFGTLKPLDRPVQSGDFVTLDLAGAYEGAAIEDATANGLSYEVGSGDLIEGIDEAITGLEADGTATFQTTLAGGEYAGKTVDITVTVKSVKERELPEADDDFAQTASEFDTLAELQDAIRAQAGEYKKVEQGVQARDLLLDHLLEVTDIPLPEGVLKADLDAHFEDGHGDDEHRAEYAKGSERNLKSQLLLDEIAQKEQLSVSEQELIEFLVRQASRYGMQPEQFVQEVVQSGQTSSFVGEVVRGKALAHVLENASITDASGNVVDLASLTADAGIDLDEGDHEGHDHDDHEGHDH